MKDKVRTIRDRGEGSGSPEPKVKKKKEKTFDDLAPDAKKAVLAALKEREENRLKKNEHSNKESKAFKNVEALLEEHGIKAANGVIKIEETKYFVGAAYEPKTKKIVDLAKLERIVPKKIWRQCLVAQVGLVEKFAGKNAVLDATSEEPDGESLKITLTEKK